MANAQTRQTGQETQTTESDRDHDHGVGAAIEDWFAGFLSSAERVLGILNGPVLALGAMIALVAELTDGKLLLSAPMLLYVWAVSQAVGVELQLIAAFARASASRRWYTRAGWLFVGSVLAFATWQAGYIFLNQQSRGLTLDDTLKTLNIDAQTWLGLRAGLQVGLIALAGITRHTRRAPARSLSAEEIEEQSKRDLAAQRAKNALNAARAEGMGGMAQAAWSSTFARKDEQARAANLDASDPTMLREDGRLSSSSSTSDDDETGGNYGEGSGPANVSPFVSKDGRFARAARGLSGRGIVPADWIDRKGLQTWVEQTLGVKVSDRDAVAFISAQASARPSTKDEGLQGKRMLAKRIPTLQAARRKWTAQQDVQVLDA